MYSQHFDNVCSLSIPAKIHGYAHSYLEVVVFDDTVPPLVIAGTPDRSEPLPESIGYFAQDPQSYDIEIIFPMPMSGNLYIFEGDTLLISTFTREMYNNPSCEECS